MCTHYRMRRTALTLALAAVFPASSVLADDREALLNPNAAEASLNLQHLDGAHPLYRQYTGFTGSGLGVSGDIDYVRRNEEAEWFRLNARNLGLRTQEAAVSYEKQGDWAIGLEFDQTPRYSPYEVRTSVLGAGTTTITQPDLGSEAAANDLSRLSKQTFKSERESVSFTASKYVSQGLKLSLALKSEDKKGLRVFGVRGGTQPSNLNTAYRSFAFAPEPINQTHKQVEASVDYTVDKFQLSAGYYGSFFENDYKSLQVIGGTRTSLLRSPLTVALAPDNSAQQFYVNGAYNFSKDTRGNLKVSYSEGKQNDSFLPNGVGGVSYDPTVVGNSLNAKVATTEVFTSLTSRLTQDLKLLASWRNEDRDDKTPVRAFLRGDTVSAGAGTTTYREITNDPESHVANWSKLEFDYRLGAGYALTAGVDYRDRKGKGKGYELTEVRNTISGVVSSSEFLTQGPARKEVKEWTSRVSLRKTMSETVNGSLTLSHSERDGSDWTGSPVIYPVYLADRDRDRARALIDWLVSERANVQVAAEMYSDRYGMRKEEVPTGLGLDRGKGRLVSVDGLYALSDDWRVNAWYSNESGQTRQGVYGNYCTGATTCTTSTDWNATLKLKSQQLGLGVNGRVGEIELGAQYLYVRDENEQRIGNIPSDALAGIGVLPDTKYSQNALKLFGVVPVDEATKVRVEYIYDRRRMDDYTWRNWVYSDGTRVDVEPRQTTHIFGVSLQHSF